MGGGSTALSRGGQVLIAAAALEDQPYAIAPCDGYSAAIAIVNGFTVATRDRSPFEVAETRVMSPWQ
nr:hypothetical protein [Leptolyngbya sp. CCY15150]